MERSDDGVAIGKVADALGISVSYVRKLSDQGVLPSWRTEGGHRRYSLDAATRAFEASQQRARRRAPSPGSNLGGPPTATCTVPLAGAAEDRVWTDIEHLFAEASPGATGILRYAFTEMLNNAIDHSDGTAAEIRVDVDGKTAAVTITDDGIGVFERLRSGLGLPDHERGTEFVSRSEAKRVMADLDDFTAVTIDFAGVNSVGQGFADEVFRVWPAQHPGVTVTPENMNDAVAFMVGRVTHRRPATPAGPQPT